MSNTADREYELQSSAGGPLGRRFWRAVARILASGALLLIVGTSVLFVDETEYVIVENLGRISAVYDKGAVYDQADPPGSDPQTGAVRTSDRGLHFKFPWPIGTVRRFDRRQQLFDPPGREMFTSDKKNITTSTYVCWRIAEPPPGSDTPLAERPVVKFFRGLGSVATAEARLDARIRSILSTEIGQVELGDNRTAGRTLLGVPHSEAGPTGESPIAELALRALKQVRQRDGEEQSLRERFGIDIVDLRIKRINLPEGNRFAVYERMRTERERVAERYRSAGRAKRTEIESQARRQSEELLARAESEAERIKGEGEAEAIGILNRAHAEDPEFYEFQRTLATYTKILNDRTTLVLSASSRLFRLLTEGVSSPSDAKEKGVDQPAALLPQQPAPVNAIPPKTSSLKPPGGNEVSPSQTAKAPAVVSPVAPAPRVSSPDGDTP